MRLRLDHARRMALAAQGFAEARPRGRVDVRHLRRVLARVKLLQIDSVNVLVRAHELPVFSRLGPYPRDLLADATYRRRELFEYWAHEASLVPVAHHPLLRHRMATIHLGGRMERFARERRAYVEKVEAEIAERGPLAASELTDPGRGAGGWWGWSPGKIACEWLFARGRLAVADRPRFTRRYDLPERVLPADVLAAPTPEPTEAMRALLLSAADALGVGTARDLADYYRLRERDVRPLLEGLVAEGALVAARVEGWRQPAYVSPAARRPRAVRGRALLAPFDPLVWERDRARRLFGFDYRIEIYTPAAQRVHGYYVLPFLLDEELVARVDLKADRAAGRLLVQAAWLEEGHAAGRVAGELAAELLTLADWLRLGEVEVRGRGDLAGPLAAAVP